jgi:hypothetical protein
MSFEKIFVDASGRPLRVCVSLTCGASRRKLLGLLEVPASPPHRFISFSNQFLHMHKV